MTQTGGEKELILGNKQLISLFFVVVALCGVFFAMGYMVRGNSLKGSVAVTDSAPAVEATDTLKRQQPEPPRETAESALPPPVTTETHPADDGAAASATPSAYVDPKQMKTESSGEMKPEVLEPGATYVQVVALPRADAETTARTLREQHLPAAIAVSSKEGLFRVLVGPYHQTSDVADAKGRLKALGFSNTIVQKQ
jgi:cell division septation protein DedD